MTRAATAALLVLPVVNTWSTPRLLVRYVKACAADARGLMPSSKDCCPRLVYPPTENPRECVSLA
jgi:hypothetical protein